MTARRPTKRRVTRRKKARAPETKTPSLVGFNLAANSPFEALWEERFAEIRAFKEKHGHARVPTSWAKNRRLGKWIMHQRELYRKGEMRRDRAERLDRVGKEWRSDTRVHAGQDRYLAQMLARLSAYRKKYGHDGVTRGRDRALHYWMNRQRLYRRAGQLSDERVAQLDAAKFPWVFVASLWEEKFERLQEYQRRFGDTLVPARWAEDPALGRWVEHQREKHRNGTLTPGHRRRLEKIGFLWVHAAPQWRRTPPEAQAYLDTMLARLAKYRKKYGHAGVTRERDRALACWIQSQRGVRKRGEMSEQRERALNAADFPWKPVEALWEEQFVRLKAFQKRFGHTRRF